MANPFYQPVQKPVNFTTALSQPSATPVTTATNPGVQQVGDYSIVLGRPLTAADLAPPVYNPNDPREIAYRQSLVNQGIPQSVVNQNFSPQAIAAHAAQANAYNQPTYNPVTQQWSTGGSQFGGGQGAVQPGVSPTANLPNNLDIMNPGPYLSDLLRNQLPGYVMGTRVPRPNQITLQSWVGMNPTMRSVLAAYWSSLGIPPEDAMQEMVRSWLSPGPTNTVRYLA